MRRDDVELIYGRASRLLLRACCRLAMSHYYAGAHRAAARADEYFVKLYDAIRQDFAMPAYFAPRRRKPCQLT